MNCMVLCRYVLFSDRNCKYLSVCLSEVVLSTGIGVPVGALFLPQESTDGLRKDEIWWLMFLGWCQCLDTVG